MINFFKKQVLLINATVVIFVLLFSMFQMVAIQPASAQNLWSKQVGVNAVGRDAYGETGVPKDIRMIVAQIIKVVLTLLGIIFLVLLITAGYKWMTSQGEESKTTEAKDQIQAAVIGLIIILMSWAIATYVTDCLIWASTLPNGGFMCEIFPE
jgi:hypothetical protein